MYLIILYYCDNRSLDVESQIDYGIKLISNEKN